jgi:hypothetical protein
MGETGQKIVGAFIASTLVDAIGELMSAAQTLSSSAQVIIEEEMPFNANQLVEAAARCIDTIELIIDAATSGKKVDESPIQGDLEEFRDKLDEIRQGILQTEGEA